MSDTRSTQPTGAPAREPALAHVPAIEIERLDVYRVTLEFQQLAAACARSVRGELRSQLERAASSMLLNLAEGFGRRCPGERRRFYSIARGSAFECTAVFDLLAVRGLVSLSDLRRARGLLVRIVQMLSKLARG
jgi:four helix bundle protein